MIQVGCAGILVADTVCGPMDALPEEGQLLALDALPATAGGCASNVAINLSKQGVAVDVCGRVGRDPAAQVVISELARFGVGAEHVKYSDTQPTSQTVILIVRGQDRRFIHVFGANNEFAVSDIDRQWLVGLEVFYIGGLFVLPSMKTDELGMLLQFCRANGVTTVLDVVVPQGHQGMGGLDRVLPYVDYFLPNNDEARALTGRDDTLEQALAFQRLGANAVVITEGSSGALALRGQEMWRANTFDVETVDPTGGGDAFGAGIIMGILRNWDMPRMLNYAGALGASATTGLGTTAGVFTAEEAEKFLDSHALTIKHTTL